MKKLKAFFYVYKNSLLNPKYYKDLLGTNMNFTIKYYIMLAVTLSLIYATAITVRNFADVKLGVSTFTEQARNLYPEDLEIVFENETWNMNKEAPVVIQLPEETMRELITVEGETAQNIPKNLLVLDKEGTIEQLKELDTLALINEKNLLVRSGEEITSMPLKDTIPFKKLENYKVTQTEFNNMLEYARYIPSVLPVVLFISGILGMTTGGVIQTLIVAMILYVVAMILKPKRSYNEVIKIAFHTSTLILSIQILLGVVAIGFVHPQVFWAGHIGYGILVLSTIKGIPEIEVISTGGSAVEEKSTTNNKREGKKGRVKAQKQT
jgi:hypothetical protein